MLTKLMRSLGARLVPTITRLPQTRVPTISAPVVVPPTKADHPKLVHADRTGMPSHSVDAVTSATMFVRWAVDHELTREWTVDEVWFLAAEDFAPAHDLALPPRRVSSEHCNADRESVSSTIGASTGAMAQSGERPRSTRCLA